MSNSKWIGSGSKMTLKKVGLKKEKGNLNGWIMGVATGSSVRVADLKIALRLFGQAADGGESDSNPIDNIGVSEYGRNKRVFDKNSKLKILMLFILFLISLTTPAASATSGSDNSLINFNFYLPDDEDIEDLVISSSFISNPILIECFKQGKGDLLNCEFRSGDPGKNIKNIGVFMEADAAENYRAGVYFNRTNYDNDWNGSYRFDLDYSRYDYILSHGLGGFM